MNNKKIILVASLVMTLTISGAVTNRAKGSEVEKANVQWTTMAQDFLKPMGKSRLVVDSFPAMRTRNSFHAWKKDVSAPGHKTGFWMRYQTDDSMGSPNIETLRNARKYLKARPKAKSDEIVKSETIENGGKSTQDIPKVVPEEIIRPDIVEQTEESSQDTPKVVPEAVTKPEAPVNAGKPSQETPKVVPEVTVKPETAPNTDPKAQDTPTVVPEEITKPVINEKTEETAQPVPVVVPAKISKGTILQMTTTAENSTTTLQYNYAENFGDGRGITFGIIGFTTGTYDGNVLIKHYTTLNRNNNLARFIPALDAIDKLPHNGNDGDSNNSTAGLDGFIEAVQNNTDPFFRQAQLDKMDELYWNPAVKLFNSIGAKNPLTQAFIYDMTVKHGYYGAQNFVTKASNALGGDPGKGIDEKVYLIKLMDLRETYLKNTNNPGVDRVAAFRRILTSGNVGLVTPFNFTVYGDTFKIDGNVY